MISVTCEKVLFPMSTYVWCKGDCPKLGRHPIFVSSPVRFERECGERFTMLTCKHPSCSACGTAIRYVDKDIGFQDCVPQSGFLGKSA